jgi:hypothetical protein
MILTLGNVSLSHATAQEVMSSLASIFHAFDACVQTYPTITKIRSSPTLTLRVETLHRQPSRVDGGNRRFRPELPGDTR